MTTTHRFYLDPTLHGSSYAGAILGNLFAVAGTSGSGSLSRKQLQIRFAHIAGATLTRTIALLRSAGWIVRPERGRYALSQSGAERLAGTPYQLYDPAELSADVTPRLAAARWLYHHKRGKWTIRRMAGAFGVHRSTFYRLLAAAGVMLKTALRRAYAHIRDTLMLKSATRAVEGLHESPDGTESRRRKRALEKRRRDLDARARFRARHGGS